VSEFSVRDHWAAQLSLSAPALKWGVRERWIGWDVQTQYGRLTPMRSIPLKSDLSAFLRSP
jgi:hypothetical protein